MRWLLAAVLVVLACTFLAAGIGKWLQVGDFAAALRLSHIPEAGLRVLTRSIPILEVAIALSLVWGSADSILVGTVAAGTLLILFSVWIAWVLARRIRIRCGCFGASYRSLGLHSLARNLALLSLASVAIWLESANANWLLPPRSISTAILVTSIAMALSLSIAFRRARPAMVLTRDDVKKITTRDGESAQANPAGQEG